MRWCSSNSCFFGFKNNFPSPNFSVFFRYQIAKYYRLCVFGDFPTSALYPNCWRTVGVSILPRSFSVSSVTASWPSHHSFGFVNLTGIREAHMVSDHLPIYPLKTNEYPLNIDGWKMIRFLLNWPLFQGHMNFWRGIYYKTQTHWNLDGEISLEWDPWHQ